MTNILLVKVIWCSNVLLLQYLSFELTSADANYHEKLQSIARDAKLLSSLGWTVEELNQLMERSQTYTATVRCLIDIVGDMNVALIRSNVAGLRYLVKVY